MAAVTFQICPNSTAFVHMADDTTLMDTQRGMVAASAVVEGDLIRNISGEPRRLVCAAPVVS